ncbi:hypothetical protein [Bradyrhizobium sp. CCBAU 53380]|uniref:hypothetical protein n=1 Tax=Bradyrhizobium sp. CCBAU 53380 TaxID=1325117 RepID=UPI002303C638|nr:hypothetical protein [Bradyrhizobium sp. CCBAU 53380]
MSEGPAEKGKACPATSLVWTAAAAEVGGPADNGSGPHGDVENDPYNDLLASLGRTEEQDRRIGIHESSHIVAARLLGHPLGGAKVDPGSGYEGKVWGERQVEAFAEGHGDASDVREVLAPVMPKPGEDISAVSDVFANVYSHCIELAAGRAAEQMLFGDDDSRSAVDDMRQARELALLICKSNDAVESFLGALRHRSTRSVAALRRCRDRVVHGAADQAHVSRRRDRQNHLGHGNAESVGGRAPAAR